MEASCKEPPITDTDHSTGHMLPVLVSTVAQALVLVDDWSLPGGASTPEGAQLVIGGLDAGSRNAVRLACRARGLLVKSKGSGGGLRVMVVRKTSPPASQGEAGDDPAVPLDRKSALRDVVNDQPRWQEEDYKSSEVRVMAALGLAVKDIAGALWDETALRVLDISRNRLEAVPSAIGRLTSLQHLDLSRNRLKVLPPDIGALTELVTLRCHANQLRPHARSLPLESMGSMLALRFLDLRFNHKLHPAAVIDALTATVPGLQVAVSSRDRARGTSADAAGHPKPAELDASKLLSQLQPLSTPTLRSRLMQTFGASAAETDPEAVDRATLMRLLLDCYARSGPSFRRVRHARGRQVPASLTGRLTDVLRRLDWATVARERPSVAAEGYFTLHRAAGTDDVAPSVPEANPRRSTSARKAAEKMTRFSAVWDLAVQLVTLVDAEYASSFTSLAVSKCFVGSPHIDTYDRAPQYALSLGCFTGGALAVEASATEVVEVDTHDRLAKVDGRFPHWVQPYTGERYSVIWFRMSGPPVARTVAVFENGHEP